LAYGDSWGYPNEFLRYQTLTATDPRGPELPQYLEVSDDTQMALYLATVLWQRVGNPEGRIRSAIVSGYLDWLDDPDNNRAPGTTCMSAMEAIRSGRPWQDATVLWSDGCGANMRVAAAAFLPDHLWAPVAAFQAAVTHGSPTAIAAAILTAKIIREAALGNLSSGSVTEQALKWAESPTDDMIAGVGLWIQPHPGMKGFGVEALPFLAPGFYNCASVIQSALAAVSEFQQCPWGHDPCLDGGEGWRAHEALATALLSIDSLPGKPVEALRRAATTGGDSDSIAAIAGAILGALYEDPWPREWMDRMEERYALELTMAGEFIFH
jgi:ADP-ribosylglycohydrolase